MGCCGSREQHPRDYTTESKKVDVGDLSQDDKQTIKRLLVFEKKALEDLELDCDADRGGPTRLFFDQKARLLFSGRGEKVLRIPFKDILNISRDSKRPRTFHLDIREQKTQTFHLNEDSQYPITTVTERVNDIIDSCQEFNYPLANFGVLKLNPHGVYQARLLQIDIPNRIISNINKGEIQTEFHFSQVTGVKESDDFPTGFVLEFRDYRTYELVCQTEEDRDVIVRIFEEIVRNRFSPLQFGHTDLETLPFWPAPFQKNDTMEKEGKVKWAKRSVYLVGTRVFVFRDDQSATPLNVITLLGTSVHKEGSSLLRLETAHRTFSFRLASRDLRDSWVDALTEAKKTAVLTFQDYIKRKRSGEKIMGHRKSIEALDAPPPEPKQKRRRIKGNEDPMEDRF